MSDLRIQAIDQNLAWLDKQDIYSGDIRTDRVHFDFSRHWDGYAKTAIFCRSKDEVYQQMLDENNSCIIPWEVLSRDGCITIGVYGVKDDNVLTTQAIKYRVQNGAVSDQLYVAPPSLTIYEQVISQYAGMSIDQVAFVEYQTKLMQQYHGEWEQKTDNFIDNQENVMQQYQKRWTDEVAKSIQDASNAGDLCLSAVSALEVEFYDMNGGIPETSETDYTHDVNGGYPIL